MDKIPQWPKGVLRAAALYNLLWGAWVVLFPMHWFDLTGIPHPNYPGIWQCVGMIVGVYGIGYWFASRDFVRHWPIILVGFLGKIFGPIGFVQSVITGALPLSWGWMILTNDLIWWVPFASMLYMAFKFHSDPRYDSKERGIAGSALSREEANKLFRTDSGATLDSLSRQRDVLLVFLRHAGCTFCRETLDELKKARPVWTERKLLPVVVHMGNDEEGREMMRRFELEDIPSISDPECALFRAYQLPRGSWYQLFGPRVWIEGFKTAILKGYGLGKLVGDGFQLSGAFVLKNGEVVHEFPSKDAADNCPWKPALVSAVLVLLSFLSPCSMSLHAQEPTKMIEAKLKREGDQVELKTRTAPGEKVAGEVHKEIVEIDLRSEKGIGECTLTRKGDHWPEMMTVRMHLRGLESFELVYAGGKCEESAQVGTVRLTGGWSSTQGPIAWEKCIRCEGSSVLDGVKWKPKSGGIRICSSKADSPVRIPLEDGCYFECTITSEWFEDENPQSIELRWVDFFRG